jgi:hypothetical protein
MVHISGSDYVCMHKFDFAAHEFPKRGFNVQGVDTVRVHRHDVLHYVFPAIDQFDGRVHRERRVRLHYLRIADAHLLRDRHPQMPAEEILARARRFQGVRTTA